MHAILDVYAIYKTLSPSYYAQNTHRNDPKYSKQKMAAAVSCKSESLKSRCEVNIPVSRERIFENVFFTKLRAKRFEKKNLPVD